MNDLLVIKELVKYFSIKAGTFKEAAAKVHAVDGVSFSIEKGETLGLVGESGCGKSTLARIIARLLEPTKGEVIFENQNITDLNLKKLRPIRKNIQIVFQQHLQLNLYTSVYNQILNQVIGSFQLQYSY